MWKVKYAAQAKRVTPYPPAFLCYNHSREKTDLPIVVGDNINGMPKSCVKTSKTSCIRRPIDDAKSIFYMHTNVE